MNSLQASTLVASLGAIWGKHTLKQREKEDDETARNREMENESEIFKGTHEMDSEPNRENRVETLCGSPPN